MCGLFGILKFSNDNMNLKNICSIAKSNLIHRGPNSQAIWLNANKAGVALTRLSILDLNSGNQPMISSNSNFVIVYNGEIVNFLELRDLLTSKKIYLKSNNSDTEVLLELFQVYGPKILNLIKGMFAFAIYDIRKNEFFLARDHAGIKPLYYLREDNFFAFASELKVFYKTGLIKFNFNKKKIDEFIVHGNISGQETLHKNIFKLEAGSYYIVNKNRYNNRKYWYPVDQDKTKINSLTLNKTISRLEPLLLKIIKDWCVSDVPTGALLSGGLDSTFVSTIASNHLEDLKLFTNYFPDRPLEDDERHLAGIVAKKIKKKHFCVPTKDNFDANLLLKLINHICDPIMDLNSLSFMGLCDFIKNNSDVKVLLTGEGSDELFAGYYRHHEISELFKLNLNLHDIILAKNILSVDRLKYFSNKKYKIPKKRLEIAKGLASKGVVNKVLENDQLTFLPGYLDRVDIISMMYGLEVRTPFLDARLITFANNINDDFKINKQGNNLIFKYILRKIFEKYVSKKVVWNKKKYQFNFPVASSLEDGSLKNIFLDYINKNSKIANYYDINGIFDLFNKHSLIKKIDHSNTLSRILSLEIFLKSLSHE